MMERKLRGAGCRVQVAGCRVQGAGCRLWGAGCRVWVARSQKIWLFLILLVISPVGMKAQKAISLEEMLAWAEANHPMGELADAVAERGEAALLQARGAFDPKLSGTYDLKEFKSTEYFNYGEAGVEWQSPYAVKIAGGYQFARGTYLNDERTVPANGQAYLAVKLPLLQGLITDAARIGRERGMLAMDRQQAMADVIRNELRYDLATRYAAWLYAERAVAINQETEELINVYLENTRGLFQQGDKAAVDTLEASVYLNTQRQATRQAQVDADLARRSLSELYWPLEFTDIPNGLRPEWLMVIPTGNWAATHPELQEARLTVNDYQLQERLKREMLKPTLDVSYYLLGDGFDLPAGDDQNGGLLDRAFKVGAKASYPIFNRKARGGVQEAELKIREGAAKLSAKTQSLEQKSAAYQDAIAAYNQQLSAAGQLADQSRRLLEAEQELFSLGESTQFLLNARQQNFQKALLNLEKLRFSRNKAVVTLRYLIAEW
ncbi:Outer membrane protein TolC [Neolewinella agarilytica]|uniref:Outer membrane protein TolC n=2 Tax=Neolewinella agarilytica TaxID=478744 RepID=A0A1H8Z2D4_9BACT|nr:Outer membrane protein TolC [Neolewinella agarilytica]